jgi:hypothetical protein
VRILLRLKHLLKNRRQKHRPSTKFESTRFVSKTKPSRQMSTTLPKQLPQQRKLLKQTQRYRQQKYVQDAQNQAVRVAKCVGPDELRIGVRRLKLPSSLRHLRHLRHLHLAQTHVVETVANKIVAAIVGTIATLANRRRVNRQRHVRVVNDKPSDNLVNTSRLAFRRQLRFAK